MSELFANPPVPGTSSPLTTLAAAITTTPVAGTVESWAVNAAAPANLRSATAGQQFRVVIDSEVMLVAASASGASPWSFTRGAEGSAIATHLANTPINHLVTQGSLGTFVQSTTQGLTITGTPTTGQVPTATSSTAANWQTPSGGGGGGIATGAISLQTYGADNTGAAYSDSAFRQAITAAYNIFLSNGPGLPPPIITGLAGKYKLGQSVGGIIAGIGVYPNISFGNFGSGADQCAQFSFPNETGYPTAVGLMESYTASSTTVVLTHCKNAFPPASVGNPQPVILNGTDLYYYSAVSGTGATQTLTTTTALAAGYVGASGLKYSALAGAAFMCAGRKDGYTFDHTCSLVGPATGSRGLWHPSSTLNGAATITSTASTVTLAATTGFPTSGEIMIAEPDFRGAITYTGVSGNTLTGCVIRSGTSHTFPTGSDVVLITPPNAQDGFSGGNRGGIDCFMYGWRNAVVWMSDHERVGPNFYPLACENYICLEGLLDLNTAQTVTSGNQVCEGVSDHQGAYWAAYYVCATNQFVKATFKGGHTVGFSPWVFWKESTAGRTGTQAQMMSGTTISNQAWEGTGLGVMGDPDCASEADFSLDGCQVYHDGNAYPGAMKYIAEFAINVVFTATTAIDLFNNTNPHTPAAPFFFCDKVVGSMDAIVPNGIARFITNRSVIGKVPRFSGNTPTWQMTFPGGVFTHIQSAAAVGTLLTSGNQIGSSGVPSVYAADGTGALYGVVVSPVSGQGGSNVGIAATSKRYGPVSVACATGGITSGSWVRGNGAVTAGTAANASGLGDTTAEMLGRAVSGESGGLATIVIAKALL